MIRHYYRDGTLAYEWRPGEELDLEKLAEYGRLMEDREYSRVDYTELPGGRAVSTVWLGLDHSRPWGDGRPVIFESMLLPKYDDCERYSTEEEARAGHNVMVKKHWDGPGVHWAPKIRDRNGRIPRKLKKRLQRRGEPMRRMSREYRQQNGGRMPYEPPRHKRAAKPKPWPFGRAPWEETQ